MNINTKTLTTILQQFKLNDAQSEELQKVIYGLLDGRLVETNEEQENEVSVNEKSKIDVSYYVHNVVVKEGKVIYESHEYFDKYPNAKITFDNDVQDEMRYSEYFSEFAKNISVKSSDTELLVYPHDKYDEQRTHIWIEEYPSLVKIVKE